MGLVIAILIFGYLFLKDAPAKLHFKALDARHREVKNKYNFNYDKQFEILRWVNGYKRMELYAKYPQLRNKQLICNDVYVAEKLREDGYDFDPTGITDFTGYKLCVETVDRKLITEYRGYGLLPRDDADMVHLFLWSPQIYAKLCKAYNI